METFISRSDINLYTKLCGEGTLDGMVDISNPVYAGLERALDSLAPMVRSELPQTAYFDMMLVASEGLQGAIPRVAELADDQVEDYIFGQGVLYSLKAEAMTRERVERNG